MVDAAKQLLIELLTSFVWLFWRVRGECTHNSVARASAQPCLVKVGRKLTARAHICESARMGMGQPESPKMAICAAVLVGCSHPKTLPQRNRL